MASQHINNYQSYLNNLNRAFPFSVWLWLRSSNFSVFCVGFFKSKSWRSSEIYCYYFLIRFVVLMTFWLVRKWAFVVHTLQECWASHYQSWWNEVAAASDASSCGLFSYSNLNVTLSSVIQVSRSGWMNSKWLWLQWTSCLEPLYVFFHFYFFFFPKQVLIYFSYSGECCSAALLRSSRNVLWTTKTYTWLSISRRVSR